MYVGEHLSKRSQAASANRETAVSRSVAPPLEPVEITRSSTPHAAATAKAARESETCLPRRRGAAAVVKAFLEATAPGNPARQPALEPLPLLVFRSER
jgi:hypothetical protein